MVATRMVCDRLSVETPSRAARSARGWMRSSGRSSEVSEITLAISGIRFIWVANSLATLATILLSAPVTTKEIARRPFSSRNQNLMSGTFSSSFEIASSSWRWVISRSVFGV